MPFDGDPGLTNRLPSREEGASALALQQMLAGQVVEKRAAILSDGDEHVTLEPAVARLLIELLGHLGAGKVVKVVPMGSLLTTQQAADLLNVSRPYLIKLIDQGVLSASKVGRHRRLKAEDVFAYAEKQAKVRAEALSEMAREDAEYL